MHRSALVILILVLAGCVTTSDTPPLGEKDVKEAARLNAELGIDYLSRGKYDLAEQKLTRALEQDPTLASAHAAIAILYMNMGQSDAAQSSFIKALSYDRDNPSYENSYGVFLCKQKRISDAEAYFIKAATNPAYATPSTAYTNAGICMLNGGDKQRAEAYLRKAVELSPRAEDALGQLAVLNYNNRKYGQARAFLDKYEAVARPTEESMLLGYRISLAMGDDRAAQQYADRFRQAFPESQSRLEDVQ